MNPELKNLSTLPDDNADMALVAIGPNGGRIDWSGTLSLAPIASEGTLKVTEGRMKAFWPYVRDAVPWCWKKAWSAWTLTTSSICPRKPSCCWTTPRCASPLRHQGTGRTPAGASGQSGRERNFHRFGQTTDHRRQDPQRKLETWAALERDGQLDWQKLFASQPAKATPKEKAEPAAAEPSAEEKAAKEPSKPWQVLLKDVQLRNYQVHLADRSQKEPVALDVGPLNADLQNFDSLNQSPFTLKLDTGVGKQGKLQAAGQVNLAPVTAKLDVSTRDIDLRVAQAYISPFIRLELRSGMLSSDLKVDLKSTEPLAFSVGGKAQVSQLHTLDTIKNRDFVKWQQLDLSGLSYVHGDALSIDKVALLQPYARFIINEDRTTNVDDLLIPQPASAPATSQTKPATASTEKPLGIRIGGIDINDGSANFADLTLPPTSPLPSSSSTARSAPSTTESRHRPRSM